MAAMKRNRKGKGAVAAIEMTSNRVGNAEGITSIFQSEFDYRLAELRDMARDAEPDEKLDELSMGYAQMAKQ